MNKQSLSFAALSPILEENRVLPTEKKNQNVPWVVWGEKNNYPLYIFNLYKNVPTLNSAVNTLVDYICGDEVKSSWVYNTPEYISDLVYDVAKSYAIYGGFALCVLRNIAGDIVKIECLDFKNVRSDEHGEYFFYSKDFNKKNSRNVSALKYPKFDKTHTEILSSIFYYKDDKYQTYPTPIYEAAIAACEIEKSIDEFHLNNINNNFNGSCLISFNNGTPDDEVKREIERNFEEKFTGKQNAGRIVIAYNEDKDHAVTIEKLETEDFSERYKTLAERSRQAIFTAFRCTPALLGIPSENNGFAAEEYQSEYVLFYRTMVCPIQKMIVKTLNSITDISLEIVPFTIQFPDVTIKDKNIE